MNPNNIETLIEEVEALCAVHVGKKAESEPWIKTCDRLERLDRLAKTLRREANR